VDTQNLSWPYSCRKSAQAPLFAWSKIIATNNKVKRFTAYVPRKTYTRINNANLTRSTSTLYTRFNSGKVVQHFSILIHNHIGDSIGFMFT
jgi:hypothetical protein